ncbi:MAG: ammonium transporter, partial [Novosphingobium sp.]|nr:ammonium transporter [Novosphingobium sp.]
LGRRQGFPGAIAPPSSPQLAMAGAALIWLGWLGLNGGSAFAANDDASAAIINTHVAASTAALVWLAIERFRQGRSTAIGFATGAIAGLAAVAPASGFISPGAAMILGIAAATACFGMIQVVRNRLEIDDSLNVFGIYGIGGTIGALLLAVFLSPAFGGTGYAEGMGMASQFMAQAVALGVVALWSAVASAILAILVSLAFPMRVSEDEEREGLDLSCHGASAGETD